MIAGKLNRTAAIAVCVLGASAVASVLLAPAAKADNASYLAAVKGLGLNSNLGDEGLLQAGKGVCAMLAPSPAFMWGLGPNIVAKKVWEQNPMLERDQAALLVNAATDNLCPGVNIYGHAS